MVKIEKIGNKDLEAAIEENDRYCICTVEKNEDTKCMCKEFREMNENGICHCGLYKKTVTQN